MTDGVDAGVASGAETAAPEVPQMPDSPVIETPTSPGAGEIAVPASNGAGIPPQPEVPEPQAPAPEIPVPEPTLVVAEPAVPQAPPALVVPAPIISSQSILAKGLEKIRFRKRAKLEKIVALARKKGSITNDDVEKLLHVSDSTAQRYLGALVQAGRLRLVGAKEVAKYEPV